MKKNFSEIFLNIKWVLIYNPYQYLNKINQKPLMEI